MSLRTRFFISVIIMILMSWADVFFVGTHQNTNLPLFTKQVIHFITLTITWIIGYYNWKDYKEKWLLVLWTIFYAGFSCFLFIASLIKYLIPQVISQYYMDLILSIRKIFSGPLPLLVFYVFYISLYKGLNIKDTGETKINE